jgi:hypothetical protein
MKKQPLDFSIKQQLESLHKMPSAQAQEKLFAKLDNHKAKAVAYRKMGWTVAALFYLSIGLLSYFKFQNSSSLPVSMQKTTSYETKPHLEKQNNASESFTLEEKVVLPNTRLKRSWEGTPLLSVNTRKIQSFKSVPTKPSLASIEQELRFRQYVHSGFASPADTPLEEEIDSLMAFATKRMQEKNTLKARKAETALKLLDAAEAELNHELFLKYKILGLLKNTTPLRDMVQNESVQPQTKQ